MSAFAIVCIIDLCIVAWAVYLLWDINRILKRRPPYHDADKVSGA